MADYGTKVTTLKDILNNPNMSLEERQQLYGVNGVYTVNGDTIERHIDRVIINGNIFTDYKAFSFLNEKSYVKSPVRSGAGIIGNLNSYATFLTPRLKIDFSMLSINGYRVLMNLIYGANEFIVTCYDVVQNKNITNKMYFAPTEMPKLWTIIRALNGEQSIELLGVEDFSVELIGTNADVDLIGIMYYYDESETIFDASDDVYMGDELIIGQDVEFIDNPPSGKKFSHWIDKNGIVYDNGTAWRMNSNLTLYAVWKDVTEYTLSFDYGLSNVYKEQDPETSILTPVNSKTVQKGQMIGTLPLVDESITIEYGNPSQKYTPYVNGGWYKTTQKDETQKVRSTTEYWAEKNTTIYCLYTTLSYYVYYHPNNGYNIPTQYIPYGSSVFLPEIAKEGYIFDGWYEDEQLTKKFSGAMPPYSIDLYAKWVSK